MMATPFYIPTSKVWGFQFLHILVKTCFFLCVYSYLSAQWYFILIFISLMTFSIFSCACQQFIYLLRRIVYSCILHIFFSKLGCLSLYNWIRRVSCISWMTLLLIYNLQIHFPIQWNIFSLPWQGPLVFKSYKFWWSPIYLFLIDVFFVSYLRNHYQIQDPKALSLLSSSKSFVVLAGYYWGFCIYICKEYWCAVFFFYEVFVWLWLSG